MKQIVLLVCAGLYASSLFLQFLPAGMSGDVSLERMNGLGFFRAAMPGGAGAKQTVVLLLAFAAHPTFWLGLGALATNGASNAMVLGFVAAALGFGGAMGGLGLDFLKYAGVGFWVWIGSMVALGIGGAMVRTEQTNWKYR